MKFFLAAALSFLASASARHENWVSEPAVPEDGVSGFDHLVSMGMDKSLASQLAEKGADGAPTGFSAAIEIPDMEDHDEREMFLGRLCESIERLFTGTMRCTCSPQLLAGIIFYECDSIYEVERYDRVAFTPSFFGAFNYQIFNMQYDFLAGIFMDGFSIFVAPLDMFVNIGNVGITATYEVDVTLNPPSFEGAIADCTFTLGNYGDCDICQSCIAPNGEPGFTVVCDFVPVAPCAPYALPRSRASTKTKINSIADGIDVSEVPVIKEAIAELIAASEAAADEPEPADEEEEEEEEEEEASSGTTVTGGPTDDGCAWWDLDCLRRQL